MTFDSLANRGDYFSAHYLAEVLPKDLKKKDGLFSRWTEQEKQARDERKHDDERQEETSRPTPRAGLRALRKPYFKARPAFAEFLDSVRDDAPVRPDPLDYKKSLHELHGHVLRALGYEAEPRTLTVHRAGREYEVDVAYAGPYDRPLVVAVECGWAPDVDAALDPELSGLLLTPVELDNGEMVETGDRLASWLLNGDDPPRYVLILAGGVITLADRMTWGEGRYLAVSLDVALGRGTALPDELGTIAALFGADSLLPPEEGGTERLAELLSGSRQHAVGVSKELRDGLRDSVEIIANEILDRLREQGVDLADLMEPAAFARELGRESLRYLYRILFLLYAEARPELGVLPADDEAYIRGYSMARLGDLVVRELVSEESRRGFHFHESLDLLFRMVNDGHNPRAGAGAGTSEGEGLRFEPLKSDLFDPERTKYIGTFVLDEDDEDSPRVDTRLRNAALRDVLRLLMLAKGKRKERGGFISYAQLGINQLGAVYEGLMSYTGFIAKEELYEVAKNGDPKDGSWMIPAHKIADYDDAVFVRRVNENGIKTDEWVSYKPGSFVYRLAGRDRQTSASYYTPESLTQVTVQLALQHRLDQDGTTTRAADILEWTICEPALGSGAFLNEAINQVAAEYLKRRQAELNERLEGERYTEELQKAKAYIALHNSYGVDLNETAVELAEVSLWLNVMHPGLQAPWFGLHLRRGNSLIGAGRRLYAPDTLKKGAWLTSAPDDRPFRDGPVPEGHIHHFLLPAQGWGAVAGEKEAKNLAPGEAKQLAAWRRRLRAAPNPKKKQGRKYSQVERLQGLSRRAEYLWDLVIKRLEISEREISRQIDAWGAEGLPEAWEDLDRDVIMDNITAPGTPYWRLKTLMDAWCALWFWPLDKAGLLDGTDEKYEVLKDNVLDSLVGQARQEAVQAVPDPAPAGFPQSWEEQSLFGESPVQETLALPRPRPRKQPRPLRVERRQVIPLNDLDDWLDFAEALLGVAEVPEDSLFPEFDSLRQLDEHEEQLDAWMGLDSEQKLEERFPWLHTVQNIAEQQGFFHWELMFAQIFNKGGFDLQVGNPPWVQTAWDEGASLAEIDPWFKLVEKSTVAEWQERKSRVLPDHKDYLTRDLPSQSATANFLGSIVTHPLLAGTQPNLYRAFMARTWGNMNSNGIVGLVHPDSHFGGAKEGPLRAATYRRLRIHAHFSNLKAIFPEIRVTRQFGVNIYGSSGEIGFAHFSWLFDPATLLESLPSDRMGGLPGMKYMGKWDIRPHSLRKIFVDEALLRVWQRMQDDKGSPVEQTPLLYPITSAEQDAIATLAEATKLHSQPFWISPGYHEKGAKDAGLIMPGHVKPENWQEVILRGPHISIATPFAKQAPNMGRSGRPQDLVDLHSDAIPAIDYVRACESDRFLAEQDTWTIPDSTSEERRYTEFYRLAWRYMIPFDTERSLFAAIIPPGATHVHAIECMALQTDRRTALTAGLWATLPADYLLRITGRAHMGLGEAKVMPVGRENPLADAFLLRTLRLNCLVNAYAVLWASLYRSSWRRDTWAIKWPQMPLLGDVASSWNSAVPLRSEFARRAALIELDALAAVVLGISAESLVAIFGSRYAVLQDYELNTWFDIHGRKIARNWNTYGDGQTGETYLKLVAHLEDPERVSPPEGYEGPFYKADREAEYRQAHAVFSERLERAKAEGWTPDGGSAS